MVSRYTAMRFGRDNARARGYPNVEIPDDLKDVYARAWGTDLAEKLETAFVPIEVNWQRVGGVFSTRELAEKWISHAVEIQPNLMWKIREFGRDTGLSDTEVIAEYEDR